MDSGRHLDNPDQMMSQPSDSVERRDSVEESPVEGPKEDLAIESSPQDSVSSKVDNVNSSQSESQAPKASRKTSAKLQGGE